MTCEAKPSNTQATENEIKALNAALEALIPKQDLMVWAGRITSSLYSQYKVRVIYDERILAEVRLNVLRSLTKKLPHCTQNGFNCYRKAGFFCFWISKLKPLYWVTGNTPYPINEFFAIVFGLALIRVCTKEELSISIDHEEARQVINEIRMHTTSPHALTRLFMTWGSRERARIEATKNNTKP